MLASLQQYCVGFGTAALKSEGEEAFNILILTAVHDKNLSAVLVCVFFLAGVLKQDRGKRKRPNNAYPKSPSVARSLSPA